MPQDKISSHHSMLFKIITLLLFLLPIGVKCSREQTWIKAGYWYVGSEFPVPDINSALFTHLLCAFAHINPTTYELSISSSDETYISTFPSIVRRKNPSVITILSTRTGDQNSSSFPSMLRRSSNRKLFIESSIKTARKYRFQGLDLSGKALLSMGINMTNMGAFLDEWHAAIDSESKSSEQSRLILTMAVHYSPAVDSVSYPIDALRRNLDWVHIVAYDYHLPTRENFTRAHAALYDPSSQLNTDYGISEWINRGLPASKLVLGLSYHGYAWNLVNHKDNGIGSPARGRAITKDGSMSYEYIKKYMASYGTVPVYNATYVVNYCIINSFWIGYDDVEAIKTKVAYAKEKGLLGYNVFQVPSDYKWMLSKAAAQVEDKHDQERRWMVITWPTIAVVTLLLGSMLLLRRRILGSKDQMMHRGNKSVSANLQEFRFAVIKEATNNFSVENKLGEGGYGPVYKGKLLNGQEVAAKRLSQSSKQGLEEFENEVTLTAKLQHVNLVRLLGFCTGRQEKMLIYEYMANKSLDFYLFDPVRRSVLDWEKRVHIIEGITHGLLYLQEYSRLTIIHRDLKASNILLDVDMKPKISDFGIARSFQKDENEANTDRIVGTYGYVPPEYVKRGVYSTKYDVYSFGVLLLQIISGKKTTCFYGTHRNLNLLEYAYDLWKVGKGVEFMDPSVNDASSSCKLIRCMQVALLCVEEKWAQRPTMLEVSSMLRNETEVIPTPERPAFSTKGSVEAKRFTSQDEIISVDDATISQLEPRL